jgi:hypothetical protein
VLGGTRRRFLRDHRNEAPPELLPFFLSAFSDSLSLNGDRELRCGNRTTTLNWKQLLATTVCLLLDFHESQHEYTHSHQHTEFTSFGIPRQNFRESRKNIFGIEKPTTWHYCSMLLTFLLPHTWVSTTVPLLISDPTQKKNTLFPIARDTCKTQTWKSHKALDFQVKVPSNTRSDIKTKNKNVATHTQPENQERRETPLPPVTPNLLFTWVEKELVGFDGNDRILRNTQTQMQNKHYYCPKYLVRFL